MQVSIDELREMQADRDKLVARIATLEAKPEAGTLAELAERVSENVRAGMTPDQLRRIRSVITNNGYPVE